MRHCHRSPTCCDLQLHISAMNDKGSKQPKAAEPRSSTCSSNKKSSRNRQYVKNHSHSRFRKLDVKWRLSTTSSYEDSACTSSCIAYSSASELASIICNLMCRFIIISQVQPIRQRHIDMHTTPHLPFTFFMIGPPDN